MAVSGCPRLCSVLSSGLESLDVSNNITHNCCDFKTDSVKCPQDNIFSPASLSQELLNSTKDLVLVVIWRLLKWRDKPDLHLI